MECCCKSRGGQEDDERAGAPLLRRQVGRVEVIQPGQEQTSGRCYSTFYYLKVATRKLKGDFLPSWSERTKRNSPFQSKLFWVLPAVSLLKDRNSLLWTWKIIINDTKKSYCNCKNCSKCKTTYCLKILISSEKCLSSVIWAPFLMTSDPHWKRKECNNKRSLNPYFPFGLLYYNKLLFRTATWEWKK